MSNVTGMTGFGRGERAGDFGTVSVEARSVNGKGLDLRLRLPAGFDAIEPSCASWPSARFNRGSVTSTSPITPPEGEAGGPDR
jgi:uncharacterized protein YicC (UPF0701 family)